VATFPEKAPQMDQQGSVGGDSRMLRAWQLALLRFAVTLERADRMNVMAIAKEIDQGRRGPGEQANFGFFRRTSADLCTAIERRNESADVILRQYLAQIDDTRLRRAFAGAIELDCRAPTVKKPKNDSWLWRGLSPAVVTRSARDDQLTCPRSDECFARHFGPGPRM
jgi:hypothetical protein